MSDKTVAEWLGVRKAAALIIAAETAEITWCYAQTLDPYGVYPELPEELARSGASTSPAPGTDIWVHFGDLPQSTRDALWARYDRDPCLTESWPFWD